MKIKKVKLGELCTIEKGKIGISKAIPGEYPLVVTAEERLSHNEYHFEGNAVVIPLVSSTGHGHRSLKRIHFQSGRFAVGSILCVVMPKDEKILRADYLYRFLDLNKEQELVGRMRGMANVTLPMSEIGEIEIPLPPVKEQEAFVKRYSKLEKHSFEIGDELTHQLSLVKQLRQAFLREAMQGKLVPQNPADGHAKDLLAQIKAEKAKLGKKEKPLPPIKPEEIPFEIPEGWVWCRLGEVCDEVLGGFAFDSTRYSKTETNNQVIRLGNVKPNQIVLDASPVFINDQYAEEAGRSKLKEGDILITMTGTRAKRDYLFSLAIQKGDLTEKNLYLNQRVGCFRISKLLSIGFLNLALKDSRLLEPVFISATGAANQANVGVMALKEILIPLPSYNEQQRIETKMEKLRLLCNGSDEIVKISQNQIDRLLQQVLRDALN